MKVLTIVNDLGRGGTQRVAVDVALCYHQNGHDSAVLTWRGTGPRADDLADAGISVFTAEHQSDSPDTPWNTMARDWAPDVIHFHRFGTSNESENKLIHFLKDGRGSQVKVIEHSHFGRCDRGSERGLIDAHIQISKWCLWRWRKWARGLSDKPVGVYIPHMVFADKFTPSDPEQALIFRDQHGVPRDAFVYGFLAQPLRAKWSPVLFDSFMAVAKADPNVYLMLAGIGNELKDLYEDFPDNIRSRIIILPFINGDDALGTMYSAMDVFVHTTRIGETFGLILTESMCCQTAIATMENPTRDNAQPEIVGHKRGGVVAAHPKALVDAMKLLKDDRELLEHCRVHGRKYVIDTFHPDRVGKMLISLLEHVHSSTSAQDLSSRISRDPLLISDVSDSQINEAGGGRVGRYTLLQVITQFLVLRPMCQTMLWKYKQFKAK